MIFNLKKKLLQYDIMYIYNKYIEVILTERETKSCVNPLNLHLMQQHAPYSCFPV